MVEVMCTDPTFIVHFKDRNVAFANGFARLLADEKQCDLTFMVEGKAVKAHRHILSFVSESLKAQFDKLPESGLFEIQWRDGSYEMAKNMMHYIYNGVIRLKQSELKEFVRAAQWLDVSTDLQDLNLEAILATPRDISEIIWNGWGEEFVNGFQNLYTEKKFFDVTLQVEGKELQAHRQLLSACSTYFEAMFSVCDIDKPVQATMDANVTYESMQNLLRYIYFGEVTVNDMIELLNSGETLEISGLERADNILVERPSEHNPNVFHVYSWSKENNAAAHPLIIKMKLSKSEAAQKANKSRHVAYETDSEGSIYDPDEDSDNGGMRLRQRRTPMVKKQSKASMQSVNKSTKGSLSRTKQNLQTNIRVQPTAAKKGVNDASYSMNIVLTQDELQQLAPIFSPVVKPKKGLNTRQSRKQAANPFAEKKQSKASMQSVNKSTKGSLSRTKQNLQTNIRVKPTAVKKSVNDATDSMNIVLTQDELQQLAPICDPIDESFEQEEGAVGFSPEHDEDGDAVLAAPVSLKRKRGDRDDNNKCSQHGLAGNPCRAYAHTKEIDDETKVRLPSNNKHTHAPKYTADDSELNNNEFRPPNEYGSHDEDMVDSTLSYGENVYVEDLTIDQHDHDQSDHDELVDSDDDNELDEQPQAAEGKATGAKPKTKKTVGRPRGIGKNAAPKDDDGYGEVANFIITPRGARVLAHGGHRYSKSRESSNFTRWLCTQSSLAGNPCYAYAYTKDIDDETKAHFPPNNRHTHAPKYTASKGGKAGSLGAWNRGIGKNAAPNDDDEYNEVANFIITPRGARVLAHGGHRYMKHREYSDYTRWICTRTGRGDDQCIAYAYTKDIDDETKVRLPPNNRHTHAPKYTADME